MVVMETLQSWAFLLVLLATAALGTYLLVGFMTWVSGEQIVVERTPQCPAAEPPQVHPSQTSDPRE